MSRFDLPERSRAAWWLFVLALAAFVAYVFLSFVGTAMLGLFVYYATRPAYRRIRTVVPSNGVAAACTMLTVAIPALAILGWVAFEALQELGPTLQNYQDVISPYVNVDALTNNPWTTVMQVVQDPQATGESQAISTVITYLQTVASGLTHIFLATAFAFYLLRDQHRIRSWFESEFGGDGTAVHEYAAAVDADLQTIYFGNVLVIGLVAVLALVTYNGYNVVAPGALAIPFPTALALATGLTSLIPIVVGKVVYVPLTAYLAFVASNAPDASLAYPAGLFVVCLLFLDLIPMTFLLPGVAGRDTHVGLIMFAYILGTLLFGWYGLFLGPLAAVLVVQALRLVFSELVHGEPVTPNTRAAESLGSDPD